MYGNKQLIRQDEMQEGIKYESTVVSGEYTKKDGRYYYTNHATGVYMMEVKLPAEKNIDSWAYMVYLKNKGVMQ